MREVFQSVAASPSTPTPSGLSSSAPSRSPSSRPASSATAWPKATVTRPWPAPSSVSLPTNPSSSVSDVSSATREPTRWPSWWRHYRRGRPQAPRLVLSALSTKSSSATTTSWSPVGGPRRSSGAPCRGCEFLIAPSPVGVVQPRRPRGLARRQPGDRERTVRGHRRALSDAAVGGLWFSDVVEFDVMVDRLLSDDALRDPSGLARRRLRSVGSSAGRRSSIVTRRWPTTSGRGPTCPGPKARDRVPL